MCNAFRIGSLVFGGVLVSTGCVKEHKGGLELDDDVVANDDGMEDMAGDAATGAMRDDDGHQDDATSMDDDSMPADDDVTDDDVTDDDAADDDAADDDVTDDDVADDDEMPPGHDDPPVPDASHESDAGSGDPVQEPSDAGGVAATEAGAPAPGDAGWIDEEACIYHSPPIPFAPLPLDAGPDAGHPPAPQVTIGESAFVGNYLADGAGFALYIYTADLPGDCDTPPVSTCSEDCLLSWPIFEAGDRELAEGLDDHAMGAFLREDGLAQTTYYGWPLYYYTRDALPGDTLGQGKGQVWFLAELEMPNVVIMRAPVEREGIKYLADGRGFTLYTHQGDVAGTATSPPRPACTGVCEEAFRPFNVRSLRPVTELEPGSFTVFVDPSSGRQQVSFKGLPLYFSEDDATSGDMNGLEREGFSLALP